MNAVKKWEFTVDSWKAIHGAGGEAYDLVEEKKGWGPGVWQDEPDAVVFSVRTENGALWCSLRRTPLGHWCGYIAVPPGHPWHGYKDSWAVPGDVHGGVTFAEGEEEGAGPCWIIGWDANHWGDCTPRFGEGGTYRDVGFAYEETLSLARQALAATSDTAPAGALVGEDPPAKKISSLN